MFGSMLKTDPLLSRFYICKSMDQLKQVQLQTIVKGVSLDPYVYSIIIVSCCTRDFGSVDYAHQLFDIIPERTVFLWNMMIKGYSRTSHPRYAISMYIEMLRRNKKPDSYTFPFLLKGFTQYNDFKIKKAMHSHVCKFGFGSNPAVETSMIQMYSSCGNINDARKLFDTSSKSDIIAWNIMISSYNKSKLFNESRNLFLEMEARKVEPTLVTLVSILSTFSKSKDINGINHIHRYINKIEPNVVLNNALLDAYAACGDMESGLAVFMNMETKDVISWTTILSGFLKVGKLNVAREFFDKIPLKDSVSWTVMIDGYVKQNRFKESLMLFKKMQDEKVEADEFTMVSVLTACAHTGALALGEWVHKNLKKNNDVFVGNALIDMYFKCGEVCKAVDVFKKMVTRDKFTFTAMIVGFAINGFGNEAIETFNEMVKVPIKPDKISYLGVLTGCTHTGMVDEGRKFFADMAIRGVEAEVEHYGCMVDLMGRAGLLMEAYEFIITMPIRPNSVVWRAFLGACGIYKDVDLGEIAAKKVVELEAENGGGYALLCNIYGGCKRWEDLREVRNVMMKRKVTRNPGCSCVEIYGVIHEFVARDTSHFQCDQIYAMLERMMEDVKDCGYTSDANQTFFDIEDLE